MSLANAIAELEAGRYERAVDALSAVVGANGDGVIARFRQSEALSRLGRHDQAVEVARQAVTDAPTALAPSLWLAQALAEAGQFEAAAEVSFPEPEREEVAAIAAGYAALTRLASGETSEAEHIAMTILATRYAPLYSLTLRLTEAERLAAEPRWPDLPTVWYAYECVADLAEYHIDAHPEPPAPLSGARAALGKILPPLGRDPRIGWLRLHVSCEVERRAVLAEVRTNANADDLADVELELALSTGDLDRATELLDAAVAAAKPDALFELVIDRARVAQLRGEPLDPTELPGYALAHRRHGPTLDWLSLGSQLLIAGAATSGGGSCGPDEAAVGEERTGPEPPATVNDDAAEEPDPPAKGGVVDNTGGSAPADASSSAERDAALLAARPFADSVADPSNREFVEAALIRWVNAASDGPASAPSDRPS